MALKEPEDVSLIQAISLSYPPGGFTIHHIAVDDVLNRNLILNPAPRDGCRGDCRSLSSLLHTARINGSTIAAGPCITEGAASQSTRGLLEGSDPSENPGDWSARLTKDQIG